MPSSQLDFTLIDPDVRDAMTDIRTRGVDSMHVWLRARCSQRMCTHFEKEMHPAFCAWLELFCGRFCTRQAEGKTDKCSALPATFRLPAASKALSLCIIGPLPCVRSHLDAGCLDPSNT